MTLSRGIRLVLFVVLFTAACASAMHAAAQQRPTGTSPHLAYLRVRRALSCLVSENAVVDVLRDLRLKPGDTASIRYYVGTIPGSEPTPGELYIAVDAHGEQRAWLLIADPADHGRFLPIGNACRLRTLRHGWQADEGNGGLATYRTMSDFAARLIHQRSYRVQLAAHPEYCSRPEE